MVLSLKDILLKNTEIENIKVKGWVKTKRETKRICFLMINDGSTVDNFQCVIDVEKTGKDLSNIQTGFSVELTGDLVKSSINQQLELKVTDFKILGDAENYPIQPKKHTLEFLRTISHLRFRSKTFHCVFKIRSKMCLAIHKFFNENDFTYIHTPIITSNDAEGAGELFTVTSLDIKNKESDFNNDYFGAKTSLTVSGQLEAETAIFGLNKVYTFGPTFRAENSNTTRHLSEFWMVEAEMAFFDINDTIELSERFLKYIINFVLDTCKPEFAFLDSRSKEENGYSIIDNLKNIADNDFARISYTDAVNLLINSEKNKNGGFKVKITGFGEDLQSEHEKYLTDEYFKKPVIVTDYPEGIKAFYMRLNDDKKTVAAVDILFPKIGEIIGGSQREERLEFLTKAMDKRSIDKNTLNWYLDTRRYGTIVHSGFGLGLDRLVQIITGMENIRDVIPFPRYTKHCEF